MRVSRLLLPGHVVSWTIVGDDGLPIEPVESYLAHLGRLERSPETVRGHAIGLKFFFDYLADRGLDWREAHLEDVARFVGWLRAPAPNVVVLQGGTARRSERTVNHYLAAVFGFYGFYTRAGVAVADELVSWRQANRGAYKPFLHKVGKARSVPTRPVKLVAPRHLPATLSAEQVAMVLGACEHLRDRFLIALLSETGMRIGQALGLRHRDFVSRELAVHIVPRKDNANGARTKTRYEAVIPISVPLAHLYSAYMFDEYGDLGSDYVFVNLWAEPLGQPLRYQAVHKLVERLRARSGVSFNLHMLRHSRATSLIRAGVPIEVVSKLLTHSSSVTTSSTYVHLDAADLRAELKRAGVFDKEER
ncbi:MAG TPA: tyrosine-type recombinase/integrase [Acidimicrobiales bacterium]|nr:tyrosine-type recombinase/integrase [Acidimicrobiales bacterium]